MRALVSSPAAQTVDLRSRTEIGMPALVLMEEAALRLWQTLKDGASAHRIDLQSAVFLCGKGNNGGDALAMARHAWLQGYTQTRIVLAFEPASAEAQAQWQWVQALQLPWATLESPLAQGWLQEASVWIDGLWGSGLSQSLRPEAAEIVNQLERRRQSLDKAVVALDVPSGLTVAVGPGSPLLRAQWTLAIGWANLACYEPHLREFCGDITLVAVDFPVLPEASALALEPEDLRALAPPLSPAAYKGSRGQVGVLGGSSGLVGAVVLAAQAAAAAGAGKIALGSDAEFLDRIAFQIPSALTRTLPATLEQAGRIQAWVIGPGWGQAPDRGAWLRLVLQTEKPVVMDADALRIFKALVPTLPPQRSAPWLLTPHWGELRELLDGQEPTVKDAAALAQQWGIYLIAKSSLTWIFTPDGASFVWEGRNPALGCAGSGDCLAGVLGGLLAQGWEPLAAAQAAVLIHAQAGEALRQHRGWFTAEALITKIAKIAHQIRH